LPLPAAITGAEAHMSDSTLDPDNLPLGKKQQKTAKGHDTKSLGPSDSSDSGSDMAGPGLIDDDQLNLDRGTNEDVEAGKASSADAGPSIGNVNMDSDTDRFGTGEHQTAGKDPRVRPNADVDPDRTVGSTEAGVGTGLDQAEEAQLGITDEELEREAGLEREPFETEGEGHLRPARRKTPAPRPHASAGRNARGAKKKPGAKVRKR
jgi:hypothetical protein